MHWDAPLPRGREVACLAFAPYLASFLLMSPLAHLRYLHRVWKARRRGDRREIESVLSMVRPGDTVVDIGANKGSYLYWLRRAVGPAGRVIAFEPQPALASYLAEVVVAQRWKNVVVEAKEAADVR